MSPFKVAIVTGGANGIGAEIASHLTNQNMNIVIADVRLTRFIDPSHMYFIKTDVRNESSVKKMVQHALQRFGRIDCLINNAGILPKEPVAIERTSLKVWNDYIQTNLTGAFLCAKYCIPHLRKNKGTLINIASTRALQSEGNDEPYSASKGGLVAFTRALAVSLGPDIRVNCISPGWIHTEKKPLRKKDHQQHPVGRVGKPEDIAALVSFLVSDKAAFISGQNFIADGGMTVKMIYAD
jgi:NAD(P)-dependent dehydrogenase (short-subunit alcohol dehydrogenase family)